MQHDLRESWHSLGEGWRALWRRAGGALTRFARNSEPTTVDTFAWGLLPLDLVERDDAVVVELEAPGLERSNFQVEIVDGALVVRGEKNLTRQHRDGAYLRSERAFGRFQRTIVLPCEVDGERATAEYGHGTLCVELPKRHRSSPRSIRVAQS